MSQINCHSWSVTLDLSLLTCHSWPVTIEMLLLKCLSWHVTIGLSLLIFLPSRIIRYFKFFVYVSFWHERVVEGPSSLKIKSIIIWKPVLWLVCTSWTATCFLIEFYCTCSQDPTKKIGPAAPGNLWPKSWPSCCHQPWANFRSWGPFESRQPGM